MLDSNQRQKLDADFWGIQTNDEDHSIHETSPVDENKTTPANSSARAPAAQSLQEDSAKDPEEVSKEDPEEVSEDDHKEESNKDAISNIWNFLWQRLRFEELEATWILCTRNCVKFVKLLVKKHQALQQAIHFPRFCLSQSQDLFFKDTSHTQLFLTSRKWQ